MIRCKAIHKFKNKKGATWGYTLEDVNHKTITLKSEDIKKMINNNQLCVLNLKITSDGRLVQTNRHINNGMIKVPRSNVPSWLKLTGTSKNKQVAYMNNSDAYDTNSEMYKHYYDLPKTTYRGGIKDKQGYIFEVMAISSSSEVGRLTGGIYHYNVNINYNGNPIRLIGYKAAFGRCYGTNIVKDLQDGYYLEDYLQKSLDEGAECDNLQLVQNIIKDNQYNSESYYDKKEREADGKLYGDKKKITIVPNL